MNKAFFITQLESIIKDYLSIKNKAECDDLSGNVEIEEITAVLTKAKAAIERITGNQSEYFKDIEATFKRTNIFEGNKLRIIIGTVIALKSDLENDYLKRFHDIVQSEIFSDYLEMADYLENEGYKDPAAVIIGSTLESHLRELCKSNSIDYVVLNNKGRLMPKKADLMNADLAKKGIYTSAYQKQITAWLDIRNSAAHGHYTDYSKEEVKLMLQGVRQFILTTK
jgi:hypothetical protein